MSDIIQALIFIGIPMCLTYFLYRIIDRKGKIAGKLAAKFPALINHKFAIQVGGVVGFVLIFGLICIITGIPERVFYIVSGIIVGLLNGLWATIMYND
ncbi:MAG: hypothetical protein K2F81_06795 [Ruminococcus sp.]|nr:hypothetical protein [Ruminococcus sp.]